ncbi:MAG: alkylhydroperoxidase, partial [Burkholderiales bacterium]
MTKIIRRNGFTNETLGWRAWLDVVDLADATQQQLEVLDESHPSAKSMDYYRLLAHQSDVLRQRSAAFNAIM